MVKRIEAIYSKGVFKPIEALELADQQRVRLTVESVDTPSAEGHRSEICPKMETTPEARQAALDRLFNEIDKADLHLEHPLPTRDELHERP